MNICGPHISIALQGLTARALHRRPADAGLEQPGDNIPVVGLCEEMHDVLGNHRTDIADRLEVSVRTIYRDMDTLAASGVPVEGARGSGYTAQAMITLRPVNLTQSELEALHVGLAAVGASETEDLAGAARALADKIDAVLAGRFRLVMQGRSAVLEAGDAIEVPGGVLHSAEVIGDSPVVSLDAIKVYSGAGDQC